MSSDAPTTVVALRALGLGDLCTGVPALRALRRAHPGAELVLAAPAWQEPIARHAGVDRVVDTAPLAPLDPSLHGADLAVNLHGRGPQSTATLVAASPRRLVSFARPAIDAPAVAPVRWVSDEHEVRRWCRLLHESGIPADPTDLRLSPGALPASDLDAVRRRVGADRWAVVHPGAASAARRWPADRFGAVAAAVAADGHEVALTGSADEVALCEEVRHHAGGAGGRVRVLAGRTSLAELVAVVAHADLVVAGDTGVAHVASAFAVPSVVLFGPTPPAEWGPPPGGPHVALWAGWRGDPHAPVLDPGLDRIDVPTVVSAIREVARVAA